MDLSDMHINSIGFEPEFLYTHRIHVWYIYVPTYTIKNQPFMQVNIPPYMDAKGKWFFFCWDRPSRGKLQGLREASLGKFERAHRTPATGF